MLLFFVILATYIYYALRYISIFLLGPLSNHWNRQLQGKICTYLESFAFVLPHFVSVTQHYKKEENINQTRANTQLQCKNLSAGPYRRSHPRRRVYGQYKRACPGRRHRTHSKKYASLYLGWEKCFGTQWMQIQPTKQTFTTQQNPVVLAQQDLLARSPSKSFFKISASVLEPAPEGLLGARKRH